VNCTPGAGCIVLECNCMGPNDCHAELGPPPAQVSCVGVCPTGQPCRELVTVNSDGSVMHECSCDTPCVSDADCELDPADVAAGGACACGRCGSGPNVCIGGPLAGAACVRDGQCCAPASNCGVCGPPATCQYSCIEFGDANCDGLVDISDILCVLDGFANFISCPSGDIDRCTGNNVVDLNDILEVLDAYAGQDPCNCNPNGSPANGCQ
jgi:hypothetical protein